MYPNTTGPPVGPGDVLPQAQQTAATHSATKRLVLRDAHQDYWTNVIVCIGVAEALLPFSLFLFGTITMIFRLGYVHPTLGELMIMGLGALALGYTILFAITLLVAGLCAALLCVACKSLRLNCANSVGGASVGGLVGLTFSLLFVGSDFPSILLLALATVLGQIGGAHGSRRTYYQNLAADQQPPMVRFGTQQLLILTAWLALAMALLKVAGMTTESYFSLIGIWAAMQIAGLTILSCYEHSAPGNQPAVRST